MAAAERFNASHFKAAIVQIHHLHPANHHADRFSTTSVAFASSAALVPSPPVGQSAPARLLREDPPPGRTSTSRAAASDGPDLLSLASKTVAGVSSDAEAGAGPATGILQLTWCSWDVCDSVQGWMTPINADFRRKLMLTVVGFTCESKMASEERACQAGGGCSQADGAGSWW